MLRRPPWIHAVGIGLALTASACAESDSAHNSPRKPAGGTQVLDKSLEARLMQADDCPDLLDKLQADAIAKLDLEIELFKKSLAWEREHWASGDDDGTGVSTPPRGPSAVGGGVTVDGDFDAPTSNSGESSDPIPVTTGGTGGSAEGPGTPDVGSDPVPQTPPGDASKEESGSGADPLGGSDTNNQVRDVDEADFVKMVESRKRFYLLHGTQLFALDSWPASDLSLYGEPLKIEGSPSEMFVRDGKIVVFSGVNSYDVASQGSSQPRAYQAYTKVTVIELDGADMTPIRELYFEGQYTSSRRYDGVVRLIVQAQSPAPNRFYPEVDVYDAWNRPYDDEAIDAQLEAWRERTAAAIENTELSDWLPRQYEADADGQKLEIEPACNAHYTPLAGATDYGLTRVVTLDMDKPSAKVGGLTVLGASSIVYSNLDTMVLAHNDYRWDERDFGIIDQQRTALHSFAVSGKDTQYTASGWAPGHVLNQFALDAKGDVVRVSTSGTQRTNLDAEPTDDDFWQTERVNQVMTFSAKDGELKKLGTTGPIGHENETTRSTRFIDDRAYVVTFEQTDPLIVVDMAEPKNLTVLGELEIPGFSEYIHPLGNNHLLTIGQNGDESGRTGGIALQIFNVKDPTAPKLAHRHEFSRSSSSSASYDHKAFTFYDAQGLLAFPLVDYGQQFSSTLQVFRVSTKDGFKALGEVDHSKLYNDCIYTETGPDYEYTYYECYYQPDVRRGMFVEGEDDTFVYAVSAGGVTAHNLSNLEETLATVELPQPDYYYVDGYFGGFDKPGSWGGGFVEGDFAGPVNGTTAAPPPDVTRPDFTEPADAGVSEDIAGDTDVVVDEPAPVEASVDGGAPVAAE